MADITPKTRLEGQRGHIIHTRSWPSIAEHYRGVAAFAPMLRFVEALAALPVSNQLFAATSMFDLLVSDSADFRIHDSTLRLTYHLSDGMFQLRHHSFSGHDDEKSCPESEVLETFSLFVRLKYGILFERPAA